MNKFTSLYRQALLACIVGLCQPAIAAANGLKHEPALAVAGADKATMLAAVAAGKRLVAVGDRGTVLLSDDNGKRFRQARHVPTRATLNAVHFINPREGWAVGHWGVIMHTADGGETWTMQRDELDADQPLFAVWFKDDKTGLAAGLWSLLLRTDDGGKTWNKLTLPIAEGRANFGKNLFGIFQGSQGDLFIAAEQGSLYRSQDGGSQWSEIRTGNTGTFWAGITLDGGAMLVAGLRGKVYRSADGGSVWTAVESGTKSSITDIAQLSDGRIVAVGLDGVSLESRNSGASFIVSTRLDRTPNTAVVAGADGVIVKFTMAGVESPVK
ncbi:MAG: hypothetical protein A3I66_04655 [Burkholderiales bacterium RIFCSPLOWO2_02_FULL_57_36]|nr:MAG: hypothetical protein A3I66_04655 [Burkholderiales bacterium RIFCSPLOWO2_02_FULL_57_36]